MKIIKNNAFPQSSRLEKITIEDDAFSDMSHSFVKLVEVDMQEFVKINNKGFVEDEFREEFQSFSN